LWFTTQTWPAGKCPRNGRFNQNIVYKWWVFQAAVFDCQKIINICFKQYIYNHNI
jgi:hypothetical protein